MLKELYLCSESLKLFHYFCNKKLNTYYYSLKNNAFIVNEFILCYFINKSHCYYF